MAAEAGLALFEVLDSSVSVAVGEGEAMSKIVDGFPGKDPHPARHLSDEGREKLSASAVARGERMRAEILAQKLKRCNRCGIELDAANDFYWNDRRLLSGEVVSLPVNPCKQCRSNDRKHWRGKRPNGSGRYIRTLPGPDEDVGHCEVDYMTLPLPSGLSAEQHKGCGGCGGRGGGSPE